MCTLVLWMNVLSVSKRKGIGLVEHGMQEHAEILTGLFCYYNPVIRDRNCK